MERYRSQHHYSWFECENLKAFNTQEKRQQNENKHKFQFNGILLESVSQQAAQGFFLFPLAATHEKCIIISVIYFQRFMSCLGKWNLTICRLKVEAVTHGINYFSFQKRKKKTRRKML